MNLAVYKTLNEIVNDFTARSPISIRHWWTSLGQPWSIESSSPDLLILLNNLSMVKGPPGSEKPEYKSSNFSILFSIESEVDIYKYDFFSSFHVSTINPMT